MTWTSLGYDGSINEVGEAIRTPHSGASTPIVVGPTDFKVSPITSADRTLSVAAGAAWGSGVYASSDTPITVQLGVVASSNRWDAVVLRRDWNTNTTQVTSVQNTLLNSKTVPSGIQQSPGNVEDQLLALVQVTAGQSVPTSIVDLRCFASKIITCSDLLAIPNPRLGMVAMVGTVRWSRVLDANGNPTWRNTAPALVQPAATALTGWSVASPMVCRYLTDDGGYRVQYDLEANRTGSQILFASTDGGLSDADGRVLTVTGPKPTRMLAVPLLINGSRTSNATSLGSYFAVGYLNTDGVLGLVAGPPGGVYLSKAPVASTVSVRASFTFTKES